MAVDFHVTKSLLLAIPLIVVAATVVQSQKLKLNNAENEVQLVVRPHVGDTLWLQLEQTVDTRNISADAERPSEYGPVRERAQTQTVNMRMFAHSLVESSDLGLATLSATTDSLNVRTGSPGQLGESHRMTVAPADRTVRVRVTQDGAMSVVELRPGTMALDASLQGMPPMLPSEPVSVGDQWDRKIALPSVPIFGTRADGVVNAEFRFDSLTRNGRLAYVSMKGTLHRTGSARDLAPGTQLVTSGLMRGYLVLDRIRGWITEAETIIQVQSDITARGGDRTPARSVDIRLTQRMKIR
ncbi:MAG: hypothetical protein M3Y64_12080 [Gemmatimonadota bacterium]|nr:hypothetical protein [Gemmatimonadota bacterium]